jgi:hypothetical protein
MDKIETLTSANRRFLRSPYVAAYLMTTTRSSLGSVEDYVLEFKSIQGFQLKESSRYKKTEEESVEAKTWCIGRRSREVGRKTSSRRVKIKCA